MSAHEKDDLGSSHKMLSRENYLKIIGRAFVTPNTIKAEMSNLAIKLVP